MVGRVPRSDRRLHARPVPERAQVESIIGGLAVLVYREDPPAESIARFNQHTVDVSRAQQTAGVQPREAGADDGNVCAWHRMKLVRDEGQRPW